MPVPTRRHLFSRRLAARAWLVSGRVAAAGQAGADSALGRALGRVDLDLRP